MRNRRLVLFAAVVAAAVAAGVAAATSSTTGTLTQVSGASPFPSSCGPENVAAQEANGGVLYRNSEVEPWIDVNPANPNDMVGIWQQDRWSNGGSRGLVSSSTFNGGATWNALVPIPGITWCSGGTYDRATDPWVSFGPTGVVHQLALSFNDFFPPFDATDEQPGGDFDHALYASRSTDGGLTWSTPVLVRRDLDANVFNDKQSITADPFDPNYVYAIWDRLVFPGSERASIQAGFRAAAYSGPAWFSRSTTGGASYEPAREIYDPGTNKQTIGNQIFVLPDNDLVDLFDLILNTRGATATGAFYNVAVIRSEDRGATWGPVRRNGKIEPIVVDSMRTIFITDPETGDDVRTGDIIPDGAVAPNGDLYAVWQDARPNTMQADAIVVSKSTDGGFTWSQFAKVNKTPTTIPVGNQQAFTPSIDVAADGTVAVTYYDFRNNDAAAPLWTDYWIVHCHPSASVSCASSGDWGNEVRLTDAPFDMRQAPNAGGFFTGDYEGLASAGNVFTPFWSMPHGADPSSTFFQRVGP